MVPNTFSLSNCRQLLVYVLLFRLKSILVPLDHLIELDWLVCSEARRQPLTLQLQRRERVVVCDSRAHFSHTPILINQSALQLVDL